MIQFVQIMNRMTEAAIEQPMGPPATGVFLLLKRVAK